MKKKKNALQDCAFYTEWGSWSQCSVSCGGGQRIQTRSCVNELEGVRGCDGPNSNTELCSFNVSKIEPNLDYTRGILRRSVYRVAGAHRRDFEPGQHSSKETWQRWQAVGDTVSNLTDLGIKSQTSGSNGSTGSNAFTHHANRQVCKYVVLNTKYYVFAFFCAAKFL